MMRKSWSCRAIWTGSLNPLLTEAKQKAKEMKDLTEGTAIAMKTAGKTAIVRKAKPDSRRRGLNSRIVRKAVFRKENVTSGAISPEACSRKDVSITVITEEKESSKEKSPRAFFYYLIGITVMVDYHLL